MSQPYKRLSKLFQVLISSPRDMCGLFVPRLCKGSAGGVMLQVLVLLCNPEGCSSLSSVLGGHTALRARGCFQMRWH